LKNRKSQFINVFEPSGFISSSSSDNPPFLAIYSDSLKFCAKTAFVFDYSGSYIEIGSLASFFDFRLII